MLIQLTKGKTAIIDDEDYEKVRQYRWHVNHYGYAVCNKYVGGYKSVAIYMHRLVNDTPDGLYTDHINHDKLDNRKENLRSCTNRQNRYNTPIRKDNTSGAKGVRWHQNRWNARIFIDGKEKTLGSYDNRLDAARAYNEAAREHYGEFALLNNIGGITC